MFHSQIRLIPKIPFHYVLVCGVTLCVCTSMQFIRHSCTDFVGAMYARQILCVHLLSGSMYS